MKSAAFAKGALPALLKGTARQPLMGGEGFSGGQNVALSALSLAGQWLRFERPAAPAAFAVEPRIEDRRRLLPDELRRPMLRLLKGRMGTDHVAMAVARALDEKGMRPHPFDLPQLDVFVRSYAERLGATAEHWKARQSKSVEVASAYDEEALHDANWAEAPLGKRVEYLMARRRADAVGARMLLEAAWPQQNADARFRLLQGMQDGLSESDVGFLESQAKDRAPRVRQLARRMLGRLGAVDENPAVAACLERIRREQTGVLRKRAALRLELPANVKEQAAPGWIRETFAEVSPEELARKLELDVREMVEAAAKDRYLLLALALMATVNQRLDLLAATVAHLSDAWQLLCATGLDELGAMPREERLEWAEILIRPYGRKLHVEYGAWDWLHRMLDGPAPAALLEAVFDSAWLEDGEGSTRRTVQWMEVTAALCPAEQRGEWKLRIAGFEPPVTASAIQLLEFLDALEASTEDA